MTPREKWVTRGLLALLAVVLLADLRAVLGLGRTCRELEEAHQARWEAARLAADGPGQAGGRDAAD